MAREIKLTSRESEIAERIAWGSSQKEVAADLGLSRFTVDNILRKIYAKLNIGKINELSAWWFCTKFNISFDLSPLSKQVISSALLLCFVIGEITISTHLTFTNRRSNRARTEYRLRRRNSLT
ncbi:MAG: LuxR C-terminal-related transcriptional regulator, partial [Cellulosilyticaceae bacterium]